MTKTRIASLLLALVMLVCVFAGCGKETAAAITFRDTVISENEFIYWMSTYKGVFLQSMGTTVDNAAYWSAKLTEDITYGDYFNVMALSGIMSNAVSLQLFSEYGLTLTNEEINAVDSAINDLITSAGGRNILNSYLTAYGINLNMLRDVKLNSLKVAKLQEYLYGENGIESATDEELAKYYNDNYYRIKFIVLRTDKDYIRDENGEVILNEETGSYLTRDLTEADAEAKRALAKDLELRLTSGEDFEELLAEYTMDMGMLHFEDGYYINASSQIVEEDVRATALSMAIGEVKAIETELGCYIIKRYELCEDAWKDEKYAMSMFADFKTSANSVKMQETFAAFSDEIILNDMVVDSYPLANCTANFYY